MPNTYFRFKQFTVHQDQTAMKVCTDACILGAYTAVGQARRVLDIGTGTGLLALMLAQRASEARIDAVELELDAYKQAVENVQASPFAHQIQVHQTAIQNFFPTQKYDLIVTNPPFYTQHLQAGKAKQDNAWHTNTLPTQDVLQAVVRLLDSAGKAWVLLPWYQMNLFTEEARNLGLYPQQILHIHTLPTKPIWRVITAFGFEYQATCLPETLCVTEQPFQDLMKEYYLNL